MNDDIACPRQRIKKSWCVNAPLWTSAIRGHGISTRRAVTDDAVVDAIKQLNPRSGRKIPQGCRDKARSRRGAQLTRRQ